MIRTRSAIILALFIPLIAQIFISGCNGTGTGNPFRDNPMNSSPGDSGLNGTSTILTGICTRLSSCDANIFRSQCEQAILASRRIDIKIGLPASIYINFESIVQAEANQTITANLVAKDACFRSIVGLSCTSQEVLSAFKPRSDSPFENIDAMVTPACRNLF
jgi:hypothetical protein